MAVGAPHEGGGAAGVNGNQRDNSVFDAGAVYVFARSGERLDAAGVRQGVEPADERASSATASRSAPTATRWPSRRSGSRATPRASTAIRRTSRFRRPAPSTCSRAAAPRGRSRPTSRRRTPARPGTADAFGEGDQFGFSLALSADGNTLAVGALTEDGAAAGINGNQADNSAQSAGAVYVFTRAGTAWSQQAYVKPSNIDAGDMFGYRRGAERRRQHAGRRRFDEDGSARGVNGPPDNRSNGSGAAYVFTRAGARLVAAGLHQAVQRRAAGFLRRPRRAERRRRHAARRLARRGLHGHRRQRRRGCDSDWRDDLSMGAAYVFVRAGTTWSQQAFLKASNTGPNDWFGVAGGAERRRQPRGDRRLARGRRGQGHQRPAGRRRRRARPERVYLFTRSGDDLAPAGLRQGRRTPRRSTSSAARSRSIAPGGRSWPRRAAKTAPAAGVDGNPADNSADEAGAAYVFA